MEGNRPKHFNYIDFFRGIAALVVIIGHYQHFFYHKGHFSKVVLSQQPFYQELNYFYHNGAMAVKLFWVISGFVFAAAYLKGEFPSVKSFFVKRFARLYPLHLLTLCIVALLQWLSVSLTNHYQIYQFNDPYHFMLNLGFVSSWGFQKGYSFNAPIWSVSVEIFVYILFYGSLWFLRKAPVLSSAFIVGIFTYLVQKGTYFYPFKDCAIYFFLGVIVFVVMIFMNRWKYSTLIVSSILVVSASVFRYYHTDLIGSNQSLLVLLPAFVLLLSSLESLDFGHWSKKLKILGDISFSLYLLHVPIEITIMILTEYYGVAKTVFSSEPFFLAYLAFVVAVSYCSFRFYELPMRNYFRGKSTA